MLLLGSPEDSAKIRYHLVFCCSYETVHIQGHSGLPAVLPVTSVPGSPHWCLHWLGLFQLPHLHLCCIPASDCPLPFHTSSLYTHSFIYPSIDAEIFNQCLPGTRSSEPKFENKVRAIHIYLPNAPPPRQPAANQEGPDHTQGAWATGCWQGGKVRSPRRSFLEAAPVTPLLDVVGPGVRSAQ